MDTTLVSRVILVSALAVLTQALSVDEITQRQSQITIDTFEYFNEQIAVQQGELETQIEHLEARIAELETAAEGGCDCQGSPGTSTGTGTTGEEGGGTGTTGEEGGGTAPEETAPEEEPAVTQKPVTTIAPTTTMKATTTIPTTMARAPTTMAAPAAPEYQRTCAEIYNAGYTTSGDYTIDPDGDGDVSQFVVYCEMEDGEGVTVVGHDSEESVVVDGFEAPGSFVLEPTYINSVTMAQLGALADASTKCIQHAKYTCRNSGLMEIDRASGMTYAWWTDRNGQKRVNWAGAATDSETCACAEDGGCFSGSPTCNCDHKKSKNQKDEGDFSDKDLLPVLSIHLGDTGSKKERGALTLGKFECRG